MTRASMPSYSDLILPVIRAVVEAGGSATGREIVDRVVAGQDPSDEVMAVEYDSRPGSSVFLDRIAWARSYAKLMKTLESPKRGVFLVTLAGRQLAEMPEDAARARVLELDRDVRRRARVKSTSIRKGAGDPVLEDPGLEDVEDDAEAQAEDAEALRVTSDGDEVPEETWEDVLLARLHRLEPAGFGEFVLYLLRQYGLRLEHVGGPGDEGIDGIGTAPLSPVLSSRVAVQIKRWDPAGKPVGRDVVALFQRDAQTKGAERAILVTLGPFSGPARKAATATAPTVDLIDGHRLAELVRDKALGIHMAPHVNTDWFNRFDHP